MKLGLVPFVCVHFDCSCNHNLWNWTAVRGIKDRWDVTAITLTALAAGGKDLFVDIAIKTIRQLCIRAPAEGKNYNH